MDNLSRYVTPPMDSEEWGVWPLVREVKIYCNSPILATGLSLIDLPGTGDSNRARVEIAGKRMTKCERFCIVGDVQRIVDSEAVRGAIYRLSETRHLLIPSAQTELLDERLKLQLACMSFVHYISQVSTDKFTTCTSGCKLPLALYFAF